MDLSTPRHEAPRHETDFAAARALMVDGQVRPNKVSDPRIIAAMRSLPRERFLPPELCSLAYADKDVRLPRGRVLMEPMVIARLVQLARPRAGDNALVVAAGAGYGAALLAACGAQVTALEQDEALLALAGNVLPAAAPGVRLVAGPIAAGWPAGAPFDIILIEGAVALVPGAIVAQVKPLGGRLVTVFSDGGPVSHGAIGEPVSAGPGPVALSFRTVLDCATPPLPPMRQAPGFVF